MHTTSNTTLGLILAGGAGRRVEGLDKGWIEYQDRPLIKHAIDRFLPQVASLVISANRNIERYSELGYTVITDQSLNELTTKNNDEFAGPLAGIVSAISHVQLEPSYSFITSLAVSPCDTPNMPGDWVKRLADLSTACPTHVFDGQRDQYLHCLIPRAYWPSLVELFAAGERSLRGCWRALGANAIEIEGSADLFSNINRLEQCD